MDAQGSEKVSPYVENTQCTFTTVIDSNNMLGALYGFKAVPNGFLIDEKGIIRYKQLGGFDIRHKNVQIILKEWLDESNLEAGIQSAVVTDGGEYSLANHHFLKGMSLYKLGELDSAAAEWRKGEESDPDNWLIRKQIWALENPDKFYSGVVDYNWQKEQISKGPQSHK